jgi:hypothetical protein
MKPTSSVNSFPPAQGSSAAHSPLAQDIVIETAKGALILAVLERLYLTRNSSWLEARGWRATMTRASATTRRPPVHASRAHPSDAAAPWGRKITWTTWRFRCGGERGAGSGERERLRWHAQARASFLAR